MRPTIPDVAVSIWGFRDGTGRPLGVTFLDSGGLGVLIAAKKHAAASDADLALVDPSPACRSVLSISGADQFFEIREEADEPHRLPYHRSHSSATYHPTRPEPHRPVRLGGRRPLRS